MLGSLQRHQTISVQPGRDTGVGAARDAAVRRDAARDIPARPFLASWLDRQIWPRLLSILRPIAAAEEGPRRHHQPENQRHEGQVVDSPSWAFRARLLASLIIGSIEEWVWMVATNTE